MFTVAAPLHFLHGKVRYREYWKLKGVFFSLQMPPFLSPKKYAHFSEVGCFMKVLSFCWIEFKLSFNWNGYDKYWEYFFFDNTKIKHQIIASSFFISGIYPLKETIGSNKETEKGMKQRNKSKLTWRVAFLK